MAAGNDALDVLRSIDATLKAMLALAQKRTQQARAAAPKAIASDRDLDGKYGNPEVKFMPRDWTGQSFKGCRLSDCPPDLLDLIAETFEYFGRQADDKNEMTDKGKPVGDYKRSDAARCRGWAKRIRDGKHTPPAPAADGMGASEWPEPDEDGFASGDGF